MHLRDPPVLAMQGGGGQVGEELGARNTTARELSKKLGIKPRP